MAATLVDIGITYMQTIGIGAAMSYFKERGFSEELIRRVIGDACERRRTDWERATEGLPRNLQSRPTRSI